MDSLRARGKLPEVRDRLSRFVIFGTKTEAHCLRSQFGIGSKSGCLFGQLKRILDILYSAARLKVEKSTGVAVAAR